MVAAEANNLVCENIRYFGQMQSQKKGIIFNP